MTVATYVQMDNGKFLELPQPNGKPFYARAEDVFKDSTVDPATKESLIYGLYVAEFLEGEESQGLDPVTAFELADTYAVEMITSLNEEKT